MLLLYWSVLLLFFLLESATAATSAKEVIQIILIVIIVVVHLLLDLLLSILHACPNLECHQPIILLLIMLNSIIILSASIPLWVGEHHNWLLLHSFHALGEYFEVCRVEQLKVLLFSFLIFSEVEYQFPLINA
jgi:hypothetical protein